MAIAFLDDINLNDNQAENLVIQRIATLPTGVEAKIVYDNGSNTIKYYNGTGWIELDGVGIGGSGTVGTVPVFVTNTTTLGNSQLETTGSGSSQTFTFNTNGQTDFKGDVAFSSGIKDINGSTGVNGYVLFSNGTQIEWGNAPVSYTNWKLGTSGTNLDVNDGDNLDFQEDTAQPGIFPQNATKSGTSLTQTFGLRAKSLSLSTPSNYSTDVLLWSPDTSATTWKVNKTKFTDVTISTWAVAEADIGMDGFKITSLGTPSASTDAANKAYVDANAGTTYTLPVTSGTNAADIKLTDSGGTVASTVNISGTTNETTVGNLASGNITIGLPDDVTLAGELTVSGTGQSSFGGQVTVPATPSATTDAASKSYVDASVVGNLIFQGGYNAATNTPDLDSSPSSSIKKGWSYVVTAAGSFFTETVEVGDFLIAQQDAPTTLANWVTVQNNTGLATASNVGIGNVNVDGPGNLDGLALSYSSGTATVGVDIKNNASTSTALAEMLFLVYDGADTATNLAINIDNLATYFAGNTGKQFVGTSSSATTHTFNHNLNSFNVIVQLYDTSTKETVYASVDRTSVNQVVATTASSASLTCLIDKIG